MLGRHSTFLVALLVACTPVTAEPTVVHPPRSETAAPSPAAEPAAPSPAAEPAAPSPAAPNVPELDATVPAEYRCSVTVQGVLADDSYRGSPDSPARQDSISRMSAEDRERDQAESHGESYRQCEYGVVVEGKPWRYIAAWSTLLGALPTSWCDDARDHVAAEIQRVTLGCKELHRGAYWGSDLTPQ